MDIDIPYLIKHRKSKKIIFESLPMYSLIRESVSIRVALRQALNAGVDLSFADLSGADLSDMNLDCVNFKNVDLKGAILRGASLRGAILDAVTLKNADLTGADLTGAQILSSDLSYSCLYKAVLKFARLKYSNFSFVDLRGAVLPDNESFLCDFTGAKFKNNIKTVNEVTE